MVEATPSREIPGKKRVGGLFLFITDEEGNALFFENNQTKESTQKVRGQLTTPAETLEKGEKILTDCLPRTIREEVGRIQSCSQPLFRGTAHFNTPAYSISLYCYEIQTLQAAVEIAPEDSGELGSPRWIPVEHVDDRELVVDGFRVPLFRVPIPQFADNILKARKQEKFPLVHIVESNLPKGLFT